MLLHFLITESLQCQSVSLFACLSVCLSVRLSVRLSVCLCACLSFCLFVFSLLSLFLFLFLFFVILCSPVFVGGFRFVCVYVSLFLFFLSVLLSVCFFWVLLSSSALRVPPAETRLTVYRRPDIFCRSP